VHVAILTVGDELLAGDTENTNATWLARRLSDRGATVPRILVLPDDTEAIAESVREWSDAFDAVVVTGGLGETHDDVTMRAVASAFGRDLVVDDEARADVERTVAAFREANPDLAERYDLQIDFDAQASVPEGGRALSNPVGLAPGCQIENVYVLPGVPDEMRALFDAVADDFGGDAVSVTLRTPAPEGALTRTLTEASERFDVVVGSYPTRGEEHNRIKVTGTDAARVDRAVSWLRNEADVAESDESE
jgi:molybdenum cofactor synthesis domain-containing protein